MTCWQKKITPYWAFNGISTHLQIISVWSHNMNLYEHINNSQLTEKYSKPYLYFLHFMITVTYKSILIALQIKIYYEYIKEHPSSLCVTLKIFLKWKTFWVLSLVQGTSSPITEKIGGNLRKSTKKTKWQTFKKVNYFYCLVYSHYVWMQN